MGDKTKNPSRMNWDPGWQSTAVHIQVLRSEDHFYPTFIQEKRFLLANKNVISAMSAAISPTTCSLMSSLVRFSKFVLVHLRNWPRTPEGEKGQSSMGVPRSAKAVGARRPETP